MVPADGYLYPKLSQLSHVPPNTYIEGCSSIFCYLMKLFVSQRLVAFTVWIFYQFIFTVICPKHAMALNKIWILKYMMLSSPIET